MTLHVEIRGGERLSRKLRPELVLEPTRRVIRAGVQEGQRAAQSGASGLGGIPRAIVSEAHGLTGRIVAQHPGAYPMEFGRQPGAPLPPVDDLARYGEGRFLIARAIARRGIKGRFFMKHARQQLQNAILPRLIAEAKAEIRRRWGAN